jgi:hypothetical protein
MNNLLMPSAARKAMAPTKSCALLLGLLNIIPKTLLNVPNGIYRVKEFLGFFLSQGKVNDSQHSSGSNGCWHGCKDIYLHAFQSPDTGTDGHDSPCVIDNTFGNVRVS